MASNANFISQFVMGGDPCTYKESGELQAEMSTPYPRPLRRYAVFA